MDWRFGHSVKFSNTMTSALPCENDIYVVADVTICLKENGALLLLLLLLSLLLLSVIFKWKSWNIFRGSFKCTTFSDLFLEIYMQFGILILTDFANFVIFIANYFTRRIKKIGRLQKSVRAKTIPKYKHTRKRPCIFLQHKLY